MIKPGALAIVSPIAVGGLSSLIFLFLIKSLRVGVLRNTTCMHCTGFAFVIMANVAAPPHTKPDPPPQKKREQNNNNHHLSGHGMKIYSTLVNQKRFRLLEDCSMFNLYVTLIYFFICF